MTESKIKNLDGIELAKKVAEIKRKIKKADNGQGRMPNRKDILAVLELAGAKISSEKREICIEVGKTSSGNVFSRHYKEGDFIEIKFKGKHFFGNTADSYFAINWKMFICLNVDMINAIEIAKNKRISQ